MGEKRGGKKKKSPMGENDSFFSSVLSGQEKRAVSLGRRKSLPFCLCLREKKGGKGGTYREQEKVAYSLLVTSPRRKKEEKNSARPTRTTFVPAQEGRKARGVPPVGPYEEKKGE